MDGRWSWLKYMKADMAPLGAFLSFFFLAGFFFFTSSSSLLFACYITVLVKNRTRASFAIARLTGKVAFEHVRRVAQWHIVHVLVFFHV